MRKAVPSRMEKAIISPASMRKMKAEPARRGVTGEAPFWIPLPAGHWSVCRPRLSSLLAAQRSGHGRHRIVR